MFFNFQKYIQPISYLNLKKKNGKTVYPKIESVSERYLQYVIFDHDYSKKHIADLDASWQLVQKGYISNENTLDFDTTVVPIIDEYRFIRKYYHPVWNIYVLLLRLLTLHNPYAEIQAFVKNRNVQKVNVYKNPIQRPEWENFDSLLIKNNPKISIIIPTLNRYKYLYDVLKDLEKQTYKNFEVIVVDQSEPFKEEFYNDHKINLKYFVQKEKALWLARNNAIKLSKSDYILFCEDDIRVPKNWIENHIKALDFFNVDLSTGVFFPQFTQIPIQNSFFKQAEQFSSANALVKKSVFREIGLFDRQFEKQRMGDGEFGLRAYLSNFHSVSNPFAYCEDVKAPIGGLRQMGSWDSFRPKNWFSPRPIPSVLYLYRKYYGNKNAILSLLKNIPPSIVPYKFKRNKKFLFLGFIISIFIFPIILMQVFISWKKSSNKLKEGAKIEYI